MTSDAGSKGRRPRERIGRFTVISRATTGAQASSYICVDRYGDFVFVKEYPPRMPADFMERLKREIQSLATLTSAYLPEYRDSDLTAASPWLAMEFVPGDNLGSIVRKHGPYTVGQVARLGVQLASALEELHMANLVHRDVKPTNVMISSRHAKLVDLGLVGGPQTMKMTQTGFQPGTPNYMSPEQEEGRELTGASDVYSLALTLAHGGGFHAARNLDGTSGFAITGTYEERLLRACLLNVLGDRTPGGRPSAGQFSDQLRGIEMLADDSAETTASSSRVLGTERGISDKSGSQTLVATGTHQEGKSTANIAAIPLSVPDNAKATAPVQFTVLGWCITDGTCSRCPGYVDFSAGYRGVCSHSCHGPI